ncbi:ClbS/DfsB family four-helix bundle protein [Paenibacillus sp. MMS20-IR301]|uniref:ClbS/DfsB family four-helix bundle protein n=1 Tax=Paenibacillus sp. MMS20-IR301 TaxID=2895946 RepID=UPI0028F067FD|nr:ClbS/DfsB family four-helix bundle protein [Paenibacillus sp. MMS20-IR301]WNS41466.1 ClbS/DfsB family four-helix bundle protein [Paenibacillus sp. MMS20-IR301]
MASYEYSSKQDLLETIHSLYLLFDAEFEGIDPAHKDLRIPGADKTPAEMIAYQLGWLELVMSWDRDEQEGQTFLMPAQDYKWNQLGGLYQSFYDKYSQYSLSELRELFRQLEQQWLEWIHTLTEDELFIQGSRKWTGTKENWPMARWIHINSAAPFRTFRGKIRKWKKHLPAALA